MKAMNKSLSLAAGALLASAATSTAVDANPFGYSVLAAGYQQETQQQEAKCGAKDKEKTKEGKCGEGKCGEGKCGEKHKDKMKDKAKEGKCGEGKCGGADKDKAKDHADDKTKEGKCGEGKCGEGKCGAA